MKTRCNKKALSPVIASVLLILLTMVLAVIVFLWARGFLGEQVEKFERPIEDSCEALSFEARLTQGTGGRSAIEVVNTGDIDIYNFEVKKINGGDSETEKFAIFVEASKGVTQEIELFMTEKRTIPEKIIVYPSLLGTVKGKGINKGVSCIEQGVHLEVPQD